MGLIDIELTLTDEERAARDMAHQFAAEVMRPAGVALDRTLDPADVIAPNSVLWDVLKQYHALGIGKIATDPHMDPIAKARMMMLINEELAWGDVGLAQTVGLTHFHQEWVGQTGDPLLRERFCAPDRPIPACWALTEPDHGSDTVAFTEPYFSDPTLRANCTARRVGDEYVISGQKAAWVTNGTIAEIALLFCTVDPSQGFKGGAGFLVPLDLPGVERSKPVKKIGHRASNQGALYFNDVVVPARYMVVPPEAYAAVLELSLAWGNAHVAIEALGVARAALEHALAYAKERVQGSRPIVEHQSVKARLFKMFMKVEAARALARRVLLYTAAHGPQIQHSIASKVCCSSTAFEVASEAVQIFGGVGLTEEYPVEKLLRDARACMLQDGCNEVLSLMGASRL